MNIILLGKTASGKTTIARKLCEEHGFKKIVTYTTRAMRKGEIEGQDYYFINNEEFFKLQEQGFFAETTKYEISDGSTVYYGTPKSELNTDNRVVILNPEGFDAIRFQKFDNEFISFYIYVGEKELIQRLKKRGDKKDEYMRRLAADREDFLNVMSKTDAFIPNDMDIELSIERILMRLEDSEWLNNIRQAREAIYVQNV